MRECDSREQRVGAEEKGKNDSEKLGAGLVLRDLETNCKGIYKVVLWVPNWKPFHVLPRMVVKDGTTFWLFLVSTL